MNLLARAHGLQERIRPIMYLVSRGRLGNVRTVEGECGPTTRGREVLPGPQSLRDRTGQQIVYQGGW